MDDIQNAGNAQGLVMMLPMLSFFFIAPVVSNPNGSVAVLASFFPFTSPVIMIIRSAMTQVPVWQVVLSVIVLLLAVLAISLAAAKVFRVGMLMYGKTASLAEIGKWLRYREE
jgi:ABC-2 type transport system permease protein